MTAATGEDWWSHSDVRRYLVTYGADQLGDGLFWIVVPWVAVTSIGGGAAAAVIAGASVAKFLASFLVGGPLGDRIGFGQILQSTLLARAVVFAAVAAVITHPSLVVVLLFAVIYGVVDGAHEPSTYGFTTWLLPSGQQTGIQGALTTVREVGSLLSGPVAGGLLIIASPSAVAVLAACVLLLGWISLPRISQPADLEEEDEADDDGRFNGAVAGWRYIVKTPRVRWCLMLFLAANICLTAPVTAGLPLLAEMRGWSSFAYGCLAGGYAAGALLGGLVVARWGDLLDQKRFLYAVISLIPTVVALGALVWVSMWGLAVCLCVVAGVSTGVGPGLIMGELQEVTPKPLMGRVIAARTQAIVAGGPLSVLLLAVGVAVMPLNQVLGLFALLLLVVVVGALAWAGLPKKQLVA